MVKLIVLASGSLGHHTLASIPRDRIAFVFTDKNSADVIAFAKNNGIKLYVGNPRSLSDFSFLREHGECWIVSINYLFVIPGIMIDSVGGKAINIHGSLLPKYRGRTPHVWAIINGETETGATIHMIEEEVDSGGILLQRKIKISPEDTGGSILAKFQQIYPEMISACITMIDSSKIATVAQDNGNATYFPKRTPEDGLIRWEWQKERVRNWIRAQTKPYPGAFTYVNGKKVTVWHCSFSDDGFRNEMPNGLITKTNNAAIHVKTPNGIVVIQSFQSERLLLSGEIFSNSIGAEK